MKNHVIIFPHNPVFRGMFFKFFTHDEVVSDLPAGLYPSAVLYTVGL